MNVFLKSETAKNYDTYYQTGFGKRVDQIEKDIVSELIKHTPRGDMLEIGCGTGHWTDFFIQKGFSVTGVDISRAMLDIAIKKNILAHFVQADACKLPFNDGCFPVLASITMIEFIDEQDRAFDEMYRVLKPGGWFIIACLNKDSVLGINKTNDETFSNAKFLTIETLEQKLQKFGAPMLRTGVYLSPDYKLLDNTVVMSGVRPVFIAGIVQKTK